MTDTGAPEDGRGTAPGPGGPRKRPTIRDVAREAGVSYGTVSRVLNDRDWVSPEAARAVKAAIARTGYTTNHHARSLATGRSGSIAFLLTEPQHLLFEDPNFSILLRGVAQALSRRELTLVLMIAGTPDERGRVLTYLSGGHVDGVLLVSSHAGDPLLDELVAAEVSVVACGRPLGHEEQMASVAADDRAGARAAVRHLLGTGRRRIATITGPLDTSGGVDRLSGYRDALEAAGAGYREDLVAHGDWGRESGAEAMRSLLAADPELDAVFVASDLMAAGALATLREGDRSVPADVAVVGFDDSGLAATLDPPLTTVRQPLERISEEMVRLLTESFSGQRPLSVTVPTELVVRESAPG
ncbi:DNA-binding LacI/PurR family transcriptional regulator [Kineococcus xinjiangensis]|uniref:DNA-binding LacI/PurR family transcriptional regulator n=1 Tax=Kineococcus xinjiangensis TaxID=512762 RepID=A0A2S6IVN3_9ACTN|nr:LacI family DNA-binding transcriptional regulator [Kineococcus xinjiangensis]PPK98422.1 DNA-binding LacI/PurR family transcriptional regulator [Kineococcus xinjiangensis]